jgi:hypothetical protein
MKGKEKENIRDKRYVKEEGGGSTVDNERQVRRLIRKRSRENI